MEVWGWGGGRLSKWTVVAGMLGPNAREGCGRRERTGIATRRDRPTPRHDGRDDDLSSGNGKNGVVGGRGAGGCGCVTSPPRVQT